MSLYSRDVVVIDMICSRICTYKKASIFFYGLDKCNLETESILPACDYIEIMAAPEHSVEDPFPVVKICENKGVILITRTRYCSSLKPAELNTLTDILAKIRTWFAEKRKTYLSFVSGKLGSGDGHPSAAYASIGQEIKLPECGEQAA